MDTKAVIKKKVFIQNHWLEHKNYAIVLTM